jgi:cytochrome c556
MPKGETPLPHDSDALRADIARLSKHSEKLRAEAKKNSDEAGRIIERVKDIERRLAESDVKKAKKTSGRISK